MHIVELTGHLKDWPKASGPETFEKPAKIGRSGLVTGYVFLIVEYIDNFSG